MIGLVIFDFDDTLCMTEAGCFAMENAVAKQLGLPEMSRDVHRKTWGRLLEDVLPERFPGVDAFVDDLSELTAALRHIKGFRRNTERLSSRKIVKIEDG